MKKIIEIAEDIHVENMYPTNEIGIDYIIANYGHLQNAKLCVWGYDYDDYRFSIKYSRLENDVEYESRIAREARYKLAAEKRKNTHKIKKDAKRELALKEFDRLKKTYGFE